MISYALRRLAAVAGLLVGVSVVVFAMIRLIPGDPARVLLGASGGDAEMLAGIRDELGLDDPAPVQYFRWLGQIFQGDFGRSFSQQKPVSELIVANAMPTLQITAIAMVVSLAGGIVVGTVAALRRGSLLDTVLMGSSVLLLSIPSFWLGLLLLLLFAVKIPIFDVLGGTSLAGAILPGITLGLAGVGYIGRFVRSSMIESNRQNFVVTARAKGISERRVLARHTARNAILPVLTITGLQVGSVLSGAVMIEIVFSRPGLGRLLVDSILARDYLVVQAVVLLTCLLYALINLVVDLLYPVVDPRVLRGRR
ncbi:ABC transporter permease [Nocardioides carbamazepini]|uniref:ABC transporter permease n=1 Tax=Nocardioides carbamazepini TaxID=2854259 RepID=UPI002149E76E|nr:ABC transporter permease [Nocardioides carbamazepini]MCR1782377.1 ABC transporter permease [Nocardioides carbamazepini]